MATIGFIGLGNMGLPMAINLAKAGHDMLVFDAVPAQLEKAATEGMTVCGSAAETALGAESVITMLPNGEIVTSVFNEIVPAAEQGTLIIDCSTVDVESAKNAHAMAEDAGLGCIDCPVSGGITGAAAGTLTFMIGGSEENCKRAEPYLDIMGGRQVRCGEAGAGQIAKICNNMLLSISMIGASEAFNLGQKLGLEPQALFDVMSTSSGFCWSINNYCPVPGVGPTAPSDNNYEPGFASSLMIKDTKLAQQAADSVGQATPLGSHALDLYQQYAEAGGNDKDFSGIIEWLEAQQRN